MQTDDLDHATEFTETVNAEVEAALRVIGTHLAENANHLRPFELYNVAVYGLKAFFAASALDEPSGAQRLAVRSTFEDFDTEAWAEFVRCFDGESMANFVLQMPLTVADGGDEAPINRKLAFAFAEVLGPDWSQTLYRFAVKTTKMA